MSLISLQEGTPFQISMNTWTDKLLVKVLDDASNLMTNRFSMSD